MMELFVALAVAYLLGGDELGLGVSIVVGLCLFGAGKAVK